MKRFSTACGGTIVVPPSSEEHLRAHPEVQTLLAEAIGKLVLPQSGFLRAEIEMGRVVGREGRVATALIGVNDTTSFCYRLGRENDRPSRVAPGRIGEETTIVVVLAFPSLEEVGEYVLLTAWTGRLARKEPSDTTIASEEEREECLRFWSSNALVYDPEVMGEVFESTWAKVLE